MDDMEIAKGALLDEVKKFGDGTADFDAVTRAAAHAIDTAVAAGKALGLDEANKSAQSPAQDARQDLPNDAARTSDKNNGVYPFVEALVVILAYFIGSTLYCLKHFQKYSNKDTGIKLVDVMYFVVVTTLTIGYGDIYPATIGARTNTILLVLLGGILVSHLGNIVIETCKSWLKKGFFPSVIGWKKEAVLSLFSLVAAGLCIVIGMVGIFLIEHQKSKKYKMTTFDAFYLSVLTLTTVGYGDFHFRMKGGRLFAIVWMLICQPIFSEASKFFVFSCFKLLMCIIKVHAKKWIMHDIPSAWSNQFWPYMKNTLLPSLWLRVLNYLPVITYLFCGVLLLVMVFVI